MSFFDDTKNTGWALTIVGLVMILGAIVSIVGGFTGDGNNTSKLGAVIIAIGGLLAALAYLKYGNSVRIGQISGKLDVLGNFVRIVGVTTVIVGLFAILGYAVQSNWGGVGSALVKTILGFVVIWVYKKMMDTKATTFDTIVWIILLVAFVVCFLVAFVSIFTADVFVIVTSLCNALIYLMMTIFLFDADVKKKMGM